MRTSLEEENAGERPLLATTEAAVGSAAGRFPSREDAGDGAFRGDWHDDDIHDEDGPILDPAASRRSDFEHNLTMREAIKAYPMAIFWSLAVSMCVIMEGFDSVLVPNFYAFPTFQRKCASPASFSIIWI